MTTTASGLRPLALSLLGVTAPWLGSAASAHGIWVAQRAGEWVVVLGEGAADDAYKPAAVLQVAAQAGDGSAVAVKRLARARKLALEPFATATVLGVAFEDGFWSQGVDGRWVEGSRLKQPGAALSGYYRMFTRTVIAPSTVAAKPFGHPLEILPLADPMTLKQGGRLPVRVLFLGKPLPGATLNVDYVNDNVNDSGKHAVKTGAQGQAVITLRSAGLNVIKASHSTPRTDRREADEDGYAATLAFSLPRPKD